MKNINLLELRVFEEELKLQNCRFFKDQKRIIILQIQTATKENTKIRSCLFAVGLKLQKSTIIKILKSSQSNSKKM